MNPPKKQKTASKRRKLGIVDYALATGLGHAIYQPSYEIGRHTLENRIDRQITRKGPGEVMNHFNKKKVQGFLFKRLPKKKQAKIIAKAVEGARTTVRQGKDYKRALSILRKGTAGMGIVAVVAALNKLSQGKSL